MKRNFRSGLALLLILLATFGGAAMAIAADNAPMAEFFKWIKPNQIGLEFELKLSRGFRVVGNPPRQGPVYSLQYGSSLELYYATGALKITPKTDATGPCFEAQFYEANKFEATTPTGRFILRPVATPQGAKLDVEPEAGV